MTHLVSGNPEAEPEQQEPAVFAGVGSVTTQLRAVGRVEEVVEELVARHQRPGGVQHPPAASCYVMTENNSHWVVDDANFVTAFAYLRIVRKLHPEIQQHYSYV